MGRFLPVDKILAAAEKNGGCRTLKVNSFSACSPVIIVKGFLRAASRKTALSQEAQLR